MSAETSGPDSRSTIWTSSGLGPFPPGQLQQGGDLLGLEAMAQQPGGRAADDRVGLDVVP